MVVNKKNRMLAWYQGMKLNFKKIKNEMHQYPEGNMLILFGPTSHFQAN